MGTKVSSQPLAGHTCTPSLTVGNRVLPPNRKEYTVHPGHVHTHKHWPVCPKQSLPLLSCFHHRSNRNKRSLGHVKFNAICPAVSLEECSNSFQWPMAFTDWFILKVDCLLLPLHRSPPLVFYGKGRTRFLGTASYLSLGYAHIWWRLVLFVCIGLQDSLASSPTLRIQPRDQN